MLEKQWHKLSLQVFSCEEDAGKAAAEFNRGRKFHQIIAQAVPVTKYPRSGRPSAEDVPEIIGYSLEGVLSVDEASIEAAKNALGRFIIATNELDPKELSCSEMLANYIDQGVSVERGFRFLKDPLFFADSLFLKKPERIMALMMIMGLALLIYALAERQLR